MSISVLEWHSIGSWSLPSLLWRIRKLLIVPSVVSLIVRFNSWLAILCWINWSSVLLSVGVLEWHSIRSWSLPSFFRRISKLLFVPGMVSLIVRFNCGLAILCWVYRIHFLCNDFFIFITIHVNLLFRNVLLCKWLVCILYWLLISMLYLSFIQLKMLLFLQWFWRIFWRLICSCINIHSQIWLSSCIRSNCLIGNCISWNLISFVCSRLLCIIKFLIWIYLNSLIRIFCGIRRCRSINLMLDRNSISTFEVELISFWHMFNVACFISIVALCKLIFSPSMLSISNSIIVNIWFWVSSWICLTLHQLV